METRPPPRRSDRLLGDLLPPEPETDAPFADADEHAGALYPRPAASKRAAALLVDVAVALLPNLLLAAVFGMFGALFVGQGVGYLLGAGYLLARDGLAADADGRSAGKRAMDLRPLRLDDAPLTLRDSIRRNAALALPFGLLGLSALADGVALYGLSNVLWAFALAVGLAAYLAEGALALTAAGGRRFGDRLAGTQVVTSEA